MKIENWQTVVKEDSEIRDKIKETSPIKTSNSLHVFEEQYEIQGERYRLLYSEGDELGMLQKFINSIEI